MDFKKSLLSATLSTTLMISGAHATIVTTTVQGTLGNWKAWDNLSKQQFGNSYAQAVAGHDLTDTDENGKVINSGTRPFQLSISGTVSYDSVTKEIIALNLNQTENFTGGFTYGSGAYYNAYYNGYVDDVLTFSGLSWTLTSNGISKSLNQVNGYSSGCSLTIPAAYCLGIRDGINSNNHSNNLYGQSIFDFQGINAGFQTLPRSNATETAVGTHHYKTWATTAGIRGLTVNTNGSISLTVSSRINSSNPQLNYSNTATLSLQAAPVPVPASAWLLSSALFGLGTLRSRKK